MSFKILGTGRALPCYILNNAELSTFLDTSDEWITTRTGISERHIITDESVTSLCVSAAKNALENAGTDPGELDLIICATIGGDFRTPSIACLVQKELGATCPAFDINAACTGFIYALDAAAGYFERKRAKKALVIGFEAMSRYVDWTDRATCVLFGDGGGAVVLGEGDALLGSALCSRGDAEILNIPNSRGNSPFSHACQTEEFIKMNGREVYKFAVNSLCADLETALAQAGLSLCDLTYILPHQANIRIIEAAREKLCLPEERFITAISRYGNTSAGSIPIILDEANREGKFKPGDILAFCAFGGGLTSGCSVIRWTKS